MNNDDVVNLGFSLNQILGKTEHEAKVLLDAAGRENHVIERDGKAMVTTRDLKPQRVGLVVNNGVVDSYKLG